MTRCAECGERIAGQSFVVRRRVNGQTRKLLLCVWCQGSPKLDAIRARSKAQAAQLQAIASTPQAGLTSELKVLRMTAEHEQQVGGTHAEREARCIDAGEQAPRDARDR